MDRQALLEEKRRRVQQLRQKRLETKDNDNDNDKGTNTTSSVDQIIGQLLSAPQPTKQVSIGIQVGMGHFDQEQNQEGDISILSIGKDHELTTYDKAVQTIDRSSKEDVEHLEPLSRSEPVVEKSVQANPQVEAYIESELNKSLAESLKLINKVQITGNFQSSDYVYNSNKRQDNEVKSISSVPLTKITSFVIPDASTITSTSTSPHDSKLVAVAYTNEYTNSKVHSNPNGRAIIYSVMDDQGQVFPEYYLSCVSRIHCIQFDKTKPNRVIGGLADGKLVIWDLQTSLSKVVLNPQLTTPNYTSIILSTSKTFEQVNFQPHTLPISAILQIKIDSNDCILTFSEDGIINTWSSNLLAMPRFDTIELYEPSGQKEYSTSKKSLLSVSNAYLMGESNYLLGDSKTFPFLESLVLFNDWGAYRLKSTDSKTISTTSYQLDSPSVPNKLLDSTIITCSNGNSYIVASFLDWSLKIWDVNNVEKQMASIYTPSIITNLITSPVKPSHLVTATNVKGVPLLQFWDLHKKLFGSLFEIEVGKEGDVVTSLSFTKDGTHILVGFNNDSTAVWKVEDFEWSKANTLDELDNGLIEYVNKKKVIN